MLSIVFETLSLAWLATQPLQPKVRQTPIKIDPIVVDGAIPRPLLPPSEPRITRGQGRKITISGRLFFNDRRENALHGVRRDPSGNPTTECNPEGERPVPGPNPRCSLNWAGAQYVVVDVIERDTIQKPAKPIPNLPDSFECSYEDDLGGATIDKYGRYSATFTPRETCGIDGLPNFAIQLRFRLRFCGTDWCFSMRRPGTENDPEGGEYRVSHRDASSENPLIVRAGDTVEMPDGFFRTNADGAVPDFESVAANYYAALVDTVLTIHRKHAIPFFKDDFGEVAYIYPSDAVDGSISATTRSTGRVVISSFADDNDNRTLPAWPDGGVSAHEYGHVMMLRAWGGDYGFDGIGKHEDPDIDGRAADPAPQIAFKEGWANFVSFITFEASGPDSCTTSEFDDNSTKPLGGTAQTGIEFLVNNYKAICDWYDQRNDGQDLFEQHDFPAMWRTLRGMHTHRSRITPAFPGLGRTICDFVIHYQRIGPQSGRLTNPSSASRNTIESGPLRQNAIVCPGVRL